MSLHIGVNQSETPLIESPSDLITVYSNIFSSSTDNLAPRKTLTESIIAVVDRRISQSGASAWKTTAFEFILQAYIDSLKPIH